jgi:hypothetical protein
MRYFGAEVRVGRSWSARARCIASMSSDVEFDACCCGQLTCLVSSPVRIPRASALWVIREHVSVFRKLKTEIGQTGPGRVQVLADHCARYRVDSEVPVLVGLGVLTDPLAVLDEVIERNVDTAALQVDIADLQRAYLSPACSSYRDHP